jgi:maleate isomerase
VDSRIRLGMLTPSSNTVLEPVSTAIAAGLPEVSVHFGRFKVTEIALSEQALKQFDDTEILRAAELLAHAKVDVIAWNGTSASWLRLDRDERLCERIVAASGIPACTSVLAFREIFQRTGAKRIGLVTPYTDDVQERIIATWNAAGLSCHAERHSGLRDNFSFAEVEEQAISEMIRAVAREGCDAVAIVCTNMRGASLVPALEVELGIPIYDSIAVTVWKSLVLAGADPARVTGWGRLFGDKRLSSRMWKQA